MNGSPLENGQGRVIDSQIHVWKASSFERPWPPDAITPQRAEPLMVPEVRAEMIEAGVTAALLLAPTWEGMRNDYVLAAAAAEPSRFGAICRFATGDPAAVEQLAHFKDVPGRLAIRLSLNRGDVAGMVEAATRSGFWTAAERYDVPLSIYAPGRYDLYAQLASAYPGLRIAVDHAAIEGDEVPLEQAVRLLLGLARHPGIAVKASALPCFVREDFPFPTISRAVYEMVEAFGAGRVFWGSDLSRLPVPYSQLVDVFVHHIPALSVAERTLVLGDGLANWLSWPEAANRVAPTPPAS